MSLPDTDPGGKLDANGVPIPLNPWSTLLAQYANSPRLIALIQSLGAAIDQTPELQDFYDDMMNLDTAQGYGLDVWGRIVNVSRVIQVVGSQSYFGFEEATPTSLTFGEGVFFGGQPVTDNFTLSDAAYRVLIYAKAAANITDDSIPGINQILLTLFPGRGDCYCTDGEDMTMTYHFTFALTPVELAILEGSGVLPTPVGVSATVVHP